MADKQSYRPTWTTVTPVKPVEKKTTALPIVPLMTGGTLVAPVLPPAPVKLPTPVTPPAVKKNETPVLPGGPIFSASNTGKQAPHYNDPDSLLRYLPKEVPIDRLGKPSRWMVGRYDQIMGNKEALRHLDKVAQSFQNGPASQLYEGYLKDSLRQGYGEAEARRRTALDLYDDMSSLKKANVPMDKAQDVLGALLGTRLYFLGSNDAKNAFLGVQGKTIPDDGILRVIGEDMRSLTPDQQETYTVLLRGWTGTHKELAAAARSL